MDQVLEARHVLVEPRRSEWMSSLGEWIKQRREELRLSQIELARRSGLNQSTISAIEIGRTRWPTREVREALAPHLGTTNLKMLIAAGEVDPVEYGVEAGDDRIDKLQAVWADLSEEQRKSLLAFAEGAASVNRTRARND